MDKNKQSNPSLLYFQASCTFVQCFLNQVFMMDIINNFWLQRMKSNQEWRSDYIHSKTHNIYPNSIVLPEKMWNCRYYQCSEKLCWSDYHHLLQEYQIFIQHRKWTKNNRRKCTIGICSAFCNHCMQGGSLSYLSVFPQGHLLTLQTSL